MTYNPAMSRSIEVQVSSSGTSAVVNALGGVTSKIAAIPKLVAGATLALGALAGVALAGATKAAADFEEQMVEVQKVTSPETAAALNDEIREMARTMPVAHSELATIAATAGRLGIKGTDNIKTFTKNVAMMAEATDLTASEAADSFARMETLMDIPVEKTENLGSSINTLSNNMAASSREIVDAATRSSGVLNTLGLQAPEILSLNAAMNEVSASSRIAGTQLKVLGQELMDPNRAEDLAGAMGMTVDEFKRMRQESPAELLKAMVEQFQAGGEGADALRSVLGGTSRQALTKLAKNWESVEEGIGLANTQMEEGTSLQREFDLATDTFNAQLDILKNKFRDNAIALGNLLLPHLTELLKRINEMMQGGSQLVEFFKENEGAIRSFAGTMMQLATTVTAPLRFQLGLLIKQGREFARVYLDAARQIWKIVGPLLVETIQNARSAWDEHGQGIIDKVTSIVTTVLGAFRGFVNFLLQNLWIPLAEEMARVWDKHNDEIVDELLATIDVILGAIQEFIGAAKKFWNEWGDEIMTVTTFFLEIVVGVVGTALDFLLTNFRVVMALIRGDWEQAWHLLAEFVVDTLEGVLNFAGKWGKIMIDALIGSLPKELRSAVRGAIGAVSEFALPDLSTFVDLPTPTAAGVGTGPGPGPRGQGGSRSTNREEITIRFEADEPISAAMAEQANRAIDRERKSAKRQTGLRGRR